MDPKYAAAIKAGVIAAIVLILLTLAGDILVNVIGGQQFMEESMQWQEQYADPENLPEGPPELPSTGFMGISLGYLAIQALKLLTFIGAGALAAKMAPFVTKGEAALAGAIAGAVAELIHRPVAIVLSILFSFLTGYDGTSIIGSLIGNIVCCLPVTLIIGVILAVIGALLYSLIKKPPVIRP
ncbi:hypothetical protein [Methanocella arvoryzae]|uniref:Uncharacterized protein n=1 Tax=Methanocella arvoryzae (strain DSM 22066 / NBRC 105507 / MRE50) TaxID=351160 RepID=Q0W2J7_METAR|nr:hypothetical protein [Methanocella arvoryzae]CAJ37396.1 hypothetical protein RCIX2290 [Methanocella arvoryzae MRE50]